MALLNSGSRRAGREAARVACSSLAASVPQTQCPLGLPNSLPSDVALPGAGLQAAAGFFCSLHSAAAAASPTSALLSVVRGTCGGAPLGARAVRAFSGDRPAASAGPLAVASTSGDCFASRSASSAAGSCPRRAFSEGPSGVEAGEDAFLSERDFHVHADELMIQLLDATEAFVEDNDLPDSDVEYASGVLTVKLGEKGTYVINKQTPNRQVWMSSPVSGPLRYDFAGDGAWEYKRDGHDLHGRLREEFQALFDLPLDL